jgi:hypothetical protein
MDARRPEGSYRMRLRNSFWSLLGQAEAEAPEAVLERVRQAMAVALVEQLGQDGFEIMLRVRFARDIESLWYLRPDIMNAIATHQGEAAARSCMDGLTALFRGHHPGAASSRFGTL